MKIMIMKTQCGIQDFVDFLVKVHQQSWDGGQGFKQIISIIICRLSNALLLLLCGLVQTFCNINDVSFVMIEERST